MKNCATKNCQGTAGLGHYKRADPEYCTRCIASDYELWGEFVDPDGCDSRAVFDERGTAGNIEVMEQCGLISEGSC